MHNISALLSGMSIDETEIARRFAFLSFNEQDATLLESVDAMLKTHRENLTETFYAHLLAFPEIRPLLGDAARLAHLKQAQADYFSQLTSGRYDATYVENRLNIGIVHQRVGLTPKWYMSAYCKYLSEVIPLISGHHTHEPELAQNTFRALLKIIFFDMELALDTYFHAEQRALMQARSYTEQIISNMPIGFIVLGSTGKIRLANHAVLRMFNQPNSQALRGKTLGEFLGVMALDEKISLVLESGSPCNDFGFDRADADAIHSYLADISLIQIGEENLVLFMVQDVTIRKQSEEEIHRLAFYDSLTKLPNRRLMHERLLQTMSISSRSGKYGALMFIDLDNFKNLNDTRGHDVGDLLLKEVARRLIRNVREGDTVARLGGDEFVVALESLSSIEQDAANQSDVISEKIRAELNLPFHLNGIEHYISPSIGVSLFRGHQSSLDELLKQADLAMYHAKTSGRNMVCFFDPVMQAKIEQRAELEKDLRASLRLNQLTLHYQMQVNDTGRIVGAEALIRWHHPQRGMVSPEVFIPLSEEIGMITQLGDWVIEQACAQLKTWEMDPVMNNIRLGVNVSTRQLSHPYFVEQVKECIEHYGIRPSKLKLELTESFILKDVQDAVEKMQELRAIGIQFAMNDFGTGYSSLSHLTLLPLEQLKIDQSFVRNIALDKNSRVMVRTIISIASNFALEVVAEGVETDDQFAFLRQYGCHKFQGYLFGKPVPVNEFERLCRADGR